jgi:hypothetical protein
MPEPSPAPTQTLNDNETTAVADIINVRAVAEGYADIKHDHYDRYDVMINGTILLE